MTALSNEIAVIGLAGRFPGADNVQEFWENISNGVESIRFFSEEELATYATPSDLGNSYYVKAKGVLKDADCFAASFFGYSPHDAKLMDPQHRILLEVVFSALENAGIVPNRYPGQIGTFVSAGFNTYLFHCLAARPELADSKNHYQFAVSNSNDFLATRIAYKLNLTGPAQTIQTACSSSLVAIHTAYQSLLNYECDTALAGGVCITAPLMAGYLYKKDGIGSPDGHCRPFDQHAAGTVPGNGAGIAVLKRLEDAIADGDHIYAVIKGSSINNDGNKKISYTAPSVQGQEQVIRTAHALAHIEPRSITYVEAHGTGTSLGDPIEVEALTRAFDGVGLSQHCAIGSVKANIGHLDTAAGVAGFIKTILMLYHRQLPSQINFSAANPRIPFASSPFYVNTSLRPWKVTDIPRRAGVSAFGIGGTNAHVVLEEYQQPQSAKQPIFSSGSCLSRERYWITEYPTQRLYTPKSSALVLPLKAAYRGDLQGALTDILKQLLEREDDFSPDDSFDSLGVDSLMSIDLGLVIEERLGYRLSTDDFYRYSTVQKLANYIHLHGKKVANNAPSLPSHALEIKAGDADAPILFCIHPAGGNVAAFQDIASHLDDRYRVIGIRAKGWDGVESPDITIPAMAETCLKVIQDIQKHGPYYLCGSSLGGTIASELASRFTQQHEETALLALLDSPAALKENPMMPAPTTSQDIRDYIESLCPSMAMDLTRLEERDQEAVTIFFRLWKAHARSLFGHIPSQQEAAMVYFNAMEKSSFLPEDLVSPWIILAEGGIEIHNVPGNHLSMHMDKGAKCIARVLNKKMAVSLPFSSRTVEMPMQKQSFG